MSTVTLTVRRSRTPVLTAARRLDADERGFGLVELLIALMVLNVGIFATIAAFNSGALAIRRASHISTAAALADKQIESYRSMPYANIAPLPTPAPPVTGPDGRQYLIESTVAPGPQTPTGSANVKLVTVTVIDAATNATLVRSGTTFEQCAQDRTAVACGSQT